MENPENFWIPPLSERENLKVGDAAKLIFDIEGEDENGNIEIQGERMWVIIREKVNDIYIGILDSPPTCIDPESDFYLWPGSEIPFKAEHVIEIDTPPEEYRDLLIHSEPEKTWPR
jgi:hypothetical protein